MRKAIVASIQEVDPGNPWIKDASGRHTNVMALLEWPLEDSDDSDSEVSVEALRNYGQHLFCFFLMFTDISLLLSCLFYFEKRLCHILFFTHICL